MSVGYINSKWSMPLRLTVIAAVFLVPSLAQLYVYADHKLDQISKLDLEIDGAEVISSVWSRMSNDSDDRVGGGDAAALAISAQNLGLEPAVAAFENAKSGSDQVRRGLELLDQIATTTRKATDSS